MNVAELADVSYRYPHRTAMALDRISLSLVAGSFTLVVGRSGSGKSTLLRTLNGLVPHFSGGLFGGVVTTDGVDTRRTPPRELSHHAGMVFQDPEAQLVTSRVADEIAFSLEQHGVPRATMRTRVEELLDLLGIADLRDRAPSTLSGGERQRVAIAAALALHPRLLVLDEPTSQLDPLGAEAVLSALDRLNDDLGLTIVLAEHRLERALGRADDVVLVGIDGEDLQKVTRDAAVDMIPTIALPPVTQLGVALGLQPRPLTVKAARRATAGFAPLPVALPPPGKPAGGARIIVDRVSIGYGRSPVLEGVSLNVGAGEIVGLIGRNGSGKTTLLRALMGFEPTWSGSIQIGGVNAPADDPARLANRVGYVPQQASALLFRDTIAAEMTGNRRRRPTPAMQSLLERFGLGALVDAHPRDLSIGERERLALAIVLARQPAVLLLDEPTRGMDAWRKHDLEDMLREIGLLGATVVLATHDVELVARVATRVVLLGNREIVADGPPEDVLAGSLSFTTQMNLVFGDRWLTVRDVVGGIRDPD